MATQRDPRQADTVEDPKPPAPPYYIATEPLFINFVRAHNPGDRVPVDHVERYGWADMVRSPDSPAATRKQKTTEPETVQGQATTNGKGDA